MQIFRMLNLKSEVWVHFFGAEIQVLCDLDLKKNVFL